MHSACNQHALSMQTACNQQGSQEGPEEVISMQSACNDLKPLPKWERSVWASRHCQRRGERLPASHRVG